MVYRQTTEAFIRCLENALCHFGGVPKTLVVDNLKAPVIRAGWFDPDLNPKIQAAKAVQQQQLWRGAWLCCLLAVQSSLRSICFVEEMTELIPKT